MFKPATKKTLYGSLLLFLAFIGYTLKTPAPAVTDTEIELPPTSDVEQNSDDKPHGIASPSSDSTVDEDVDVRVVDQSDEIKNLLQLAEEAYWKLWLTTPADNNAYMYYQRVLAIEPENVAAKVGIERIVEKYIALAEGAGGRHSARSYLQKALDIDPESARAKSLLDKLNRQKASPRYPNISSAKAGYRAGRLSKHEYKRIVRKLKSARNERIRRLKIRYKSGEINKDTYKQKVRQVKTRYN